VAVVIPYANYYAVRFIKGVGIASDIIAAETNSQWDHVELITRQWTYLGAQSRGFHDPGGVLERPADYCQTVRERWYARECTANQEARIYGWARSKIGTGYNYSDILGLYFHNRSLNNPFEDICSQFVLEAVTQGEWIANVLPSYDHLITPETLHLLDAWRDHCVYEKAA
jgi:hypothetical protein